MRKFYVLYSKTVTSDYEIHETETPDTVLEIKSQCRKFRHTAAEFRKEDEV